MVVDPPLLLPQPQARDASPKHRSPTWIPTPRALFIVCTPPSYPRTSARHRRRRPARLRRVDCSVSIAPCRAATIGVTIARMGRRGTQSRVVPLALLFGWFQASCSGGGTSTGSGGSPGSGGAGGRGTGGSSGSGGAGTGGTAGAATGGAGGRGGGTGGVGGRAGSAGAVGAGGAAGSGAGGAGGMTRPKVTAASGTTLVVVNPGVRHQ